MREGKATKRGTQVASKITVAFYFLTKAVFYESLYCTNKFNILCCRDTFHSKILI